MKILPKEFVLTNFTREEGNEVIQNCGLFDNLDCEWNYLIVKTEWFDSANTMRYLNAHYEHLPKLSYKEWKEIVSSKKRFDYTNSREDIFYKVIYPLFSKEFLFGNDLEEFLKLVNETFILNDFQVLHIVEHWKEKENICN